LLSNQKVQRGATTLLDLSYSYLRTGTTSGRTGQLTKITNVLDSGKNRGYEYDALGRLKKATGGSTATWTQTYTNDKHGNRTSVTATGTADNGTAIPRDGFAALAVSLTTNQITTAGWLYDKAGNQVRAQAPGGIWQRYQYDAANRMVKVKADDNVTVLASYTYGDSNERLIVDEGGLRTYYARDGRVEYTETGSDTTPGWSKSYVYLGARLLSTLTPNGSGGEFVQYHHPDRLGTRLVSNSQDTSSFEQVALPFGTALSAESTGSTNRRFTTYDRSVTTGLDYATNRHYDQQQGRFTQVDPIGMAAVSLSDSQSLNMYSYVQNDPVNFTDPTGLTMSFCSAEFSFSDCGGDGGFWGGSGGGGGGGGGGFGDDVAKYNRDFAGVPAHARGAYADYLGRLQNTMDANRARSALDSGNYGLLASILNGNPNVGISVNGAVLWGEFGAAFIEGFAAARQEFMLASGGGPHDEIWRVTDLALRAMIHLGWKAVVNKINKIRGPDFQILNINAVAGITRFVARGDDIASALQGVSAGGDAQISYAVGWMLQAATPSNRDIRAWGQGLSLSADFFFIGGGGVVRSMSSSVRGVYAGFGAGGGWGASFQYPVR
jgi:RHS repeat-associated protein